MAIIHLASVSSFMSLLPSLSNNLCHSLLVLLRCQLFVPGNDEVSYLAPTGLLCHSLGRTARSCLLHERCYTSLEINSALLNIGGHVSKTVQMPFINKNQFPASRLT